jgi:ABC-type transport system involved in multi-copper enzyme maturation permease subunit
MPRLSVVTGIALVEARRFLAKKSTLFVLALFVLPVLVAVALKHYVSVPHSPRFWVLLAGIDVSPELQGVTGSSLAVGLAGLTAWWWLVVSLYGGDLFASDRASGLTRLVLSRPVTRLEYVLGKLLALLAFLALAGIIGLYSIYAASWILAGRQSEPLWPLVIGLLLAVGSVPLAALSALMGFRSSKPLVGIISGIGIYFVASMIVSLGSLLIIMAHGGSLEETALRLATLIPLDAGKALAEIVYSYHAHGPVVHLVQTGHEEVRIAGRTIALSTTVNLGSLIPLLLVSLPAWIIATVILLYKIVDRADL